MNKNILRISLAILIGSFLAGSVLAATNLSFSPVSVNVTSGETFNMVVSVNPQEIKNYTIKAEIKFPADLLEVKSFSFGSNWMPLSQSGYDLTDNTNGILIKTAGYPGGLSSVGTFGIISFSAKKAGTGTISRGDNSFALDATNKDLLSGISQASVVITAPAPVETPSIPKVPSAGTPTPTPSTPEEPEVLTPEEPTAPAPEVVIEEEQTIGEQSFLASIGNIISFGTGNVLIGIIILIIALLIILLIIRGIRKSKKTN